MTINLTINPGTDTLSAVTMVSLVDATGLPVAPNDPPTFTNTTGQVWAYTFSGSSPQYSYSFSLTFSDSTVYGPYTLTAINGAPATGSIGAVDIVSPLVPCGPITVVAGDDYFYADGRALIWTTTNAATWPDLTGASIAFTANLTTGTATVSQAGVIAITSGANKSVYVELASSVTQGMAIGLFIYSYVVLATLADGHKTTLALGSINVKPNES